MIDIGENYVKRSERNRAKIMSANGVLDLSVHLKDANRPRTPIHSIEIDYSKRWQHQHWMAILSAYKNSPYFDHFAPYLEPHFNREYKHLWELNTELLKSLLKLMGASVELNFSRDYVVATEQDIDLRPKLRGELSTPMPEYTQVFYDREPFVKNLSILDMLLCEGRGTMPLLQHSITAMGESRD